jgi:hypothetical protein
VTVEAPFVLVGDSRTNDVPTNPAADDAHRRQLRCTDRPPHNTSTSLCQDRPTSGDRVCFLRASLSATAAG